jgi:hypothetical protein
MSPIMMGGAGSPLDTAHGMFVLGHRQISTRMLGSVRRNSFLIHFYIPWYKKRLFLPRQARDKDRQG